MAYRPLPIGIEDFKELISSEYYYVDKTDFVKELLEKGGKVNLFTRPHRFGKSLNLSMLRYFFEDAGTEEKNADRRGLFCSLQIMKAGDAFLSQMNRYPVIQLSLKSAKQPAWELAYGALKTALEDEYQRHMEILPEIPIEADRLRFQRRLDWDTQYCSLAIPNKEVLHIYKSTVTGWFSANLKKQDLRPLFHALENGDTEKISEELSRLLQESISFYDYAENYYHGFLTGILQNMPGYRILSNRESGTGRPDLILKTPGLKGRAILLELKTARSYRDMDSLCDTALSQIRDRRYREGLQEEGYREVLSYGICFYQKDCEVKQLS